MNDWFPPSLRAKRSNPASLLQSKLDCFVASLLAMTKLTEIGWQELETFETLAA
jgi:hypothetical protein